MGFDTLKFLPLHSPIYLIITILIEETKGPPEPEKSNGDLKKWRAKLYLLNEDGGWDDLGTGY